MSDVVISVEGLGKRYMIGHQAQNGGYVALRDVLAQNARSIWHKTRDLAQGKPIVQGDTLEEIWALRDVDFEIHRGEAVGIIGRNGAGKSTLLKILSRITEPSTGRVTIKGRVASLLEVGTGFHPELTGRENIYLNGAILGMTRAEIRRKFDEIVAFAEVEKFLDTPVKRYSSGMYVRLAFAVAAHLEPEILVVDEVLAVGDAAFQKKCLGKMGDVAGEGRTVLFVSHNMAAISSLCRRVFLLEAGTVNLAGETTTVIGHYLSSAIQTTVVDLANAVDRSGPGDYARIMKVSVHDMDGKLQSSFQMGEGMIVRLKISCHRPIASPEIGIAITNQLGIQIHYFVSTWEGFNERIDLGNHTIEIEVPKLMVYPGQYLLTPWIKHQGQRVDDEVENILMIEIVSSDVTGHNPYFERYVQSHCEVFSPSVWRWLN